MQHVCVVVTSCIGCEGCGMVLVTSVLRKGNRFGIPAVSLRAARSNTNKQLGITGKGQAKLCHKFLPFFLRPSCCRRNEFFFSPFYLRIRDAVGSLQCIRNVLPLVTFLSVIMYVCLNNMLAVSTLLCTQTPVGHYPLSAYTV